VNAPLLNDIAPPSNSFVLPQHKMVYIPITKVACTALRWMVADLAGEEFERFYRATGAHQTRLMTIHSNRAAWEFAPQVKNVPPDVLAEISRDNGWFIFSTIRDPWTRLWSAWQSKFLVHHTPYVREYGDEPWFPRVPTKPSDILDDWFTFVDTAPWRTHPVLKEDRHFRPQFVSVRPRGVNYTKIYDLREMSTLIADIHTHLRSVGMDQELYLPRANENPVRMTADALENGVADAVRELYKRDFAEWGDRWDIDKINLAPGPLTMEAVHAVAYHASANQRISDLSQELKKAHNKIEDLEKQLARATAAKPKPPAEPPPPARPKAPERPRPRVLAELAKRRLTRP
jgi:hypothetical protein